MRYTQDINETYHFIIPELIKIISSHRNLERMHGNLKDPCIKKLKSITLKIIILCFSHYRILVYGHGQTLFCAASFRERICLMKSFISFWLSPILNLILGYSFFNFSITSLSCIVKLASIFCEIILFQFFITFHEIRMKLYYIPLLPTYRAIFVL